MAVELDDHELAIEFDDRAVICADVCADHAPQPSAVQVWCRGELAGTL
jgi:hypothetical protein